MYQIHFGINWNELSGCTWGSCPLLMKYKTLLLSCAISSMILVTRPPSCNHVAMISIATLMVLGQTKKKRLWVLGQCDITQNSPQTCPLSLSMELMEWMPLLLNPFLFVKKCCKFFTWAISTDPASRSNCGENMRFLFVLLSFTGMSKFQKRNNFTVSHVSHHIFKRKHLVGHWKGRSIFGRSCTLGATDI